MMMHAVQKLKYEKKEVAGARAFLTQEEENCVQTGASFGAFSLVFFFLSLLRVCTLSNNN
jgi:hypothetical protein